MSAATEAGVARARVSLTETLDGAATPAMRIAEDLFGLADLVKTDSRLRRSLTDPGRTGTDRARLADDAFGAHVAPETRTVVRSVVAEHWSDPMGLYDALEILGITATLEAARAAGRLEDVEHELFAVSGLLADDRELRTALSDMGRGTAHERADLAQTVFGPHLSAWSMRLLRRGVGRTSHGRLLATLRRFCERAAGMRGRVFVTVESARPLSDAQVDRLRDAVTARLGQPASLNITVDPQLIGGFRVNTGVMSIDSSVASQVTALKWTLTH